MIENLCETIPPGIGAGDLHRVSRAVLRLEEGKREFHRAGGAARP